MNETYSIALGALCDPISVQLSKCHLPKEVLRHFDMDADAITRCKLRGYLTDSQTESARKKLVKMIQEALNKQKGA